MVVLKIPRVKILNIGPLFVGMMRLVTGISEGKERLYICNLEMGGTCDSLDTFPQSMVNSSSTILHKLLAIYH